MINLNYHGEIFNVVLGYIPVQKQTDKRILACIIGVA
jgi:hypothetical protein